MALQFVQQGKSASPAIVKKIKMLAQVARELPASRGFNITRLTVIKSLCKDIEIASAFVFHLSQATKERMDKEKRPDYIAKNKWLQHKELVNEAVLRMDDFLNQPKTQNRQAALRETLSRMKQLQNEYRRHKWGHIRIIESSETLLVEKALECILSKSDCSFWAYHVAREYAERYDPSYGTGLIPESAPFMNDIVNFWIRLYGLDLPTL